MANDKTPASWIAPLNVTAGCIILWTTQRIRWQIGEFGLVRLIRIINRILRSSSVRISHFLMNFDNSSAIIAFEVNWLMGNAKWRRKTHFRKI